MFSTTPNAKFIVPSTRAAHKRQIFDIIQQLLAVSLSYTVIWGEKTQGVHEQDFMDWVEDVLKSLPPRESSIPETMVSMVEKIMKRSNECELRLVEHVDASEDALTPALLECGDGTSVPIEQVKVANLHRLSRHTKFRFGGNTARFLPTTDPLIVTFTPDPPENPFAPIVPAMSYEVLTTGEIVECNEPRHPAEQCLPDYLAPSIRSDIAPPPVTFKSTAVQTEAARPPSTNQLFPSTAPVNAVSSSDGGKAKGPGAPPKTILPVDVPSPSPAGPKFRRQKKAGNLITVSEGSTKPKEAAGPIPFPIMGPPTIVTTNPPSATPLIRDSGSATQESSSKVKKPLRRSAREPRSQASSDAGSSSSRAGASSAVQNTAAPPSLKKGKKRAREELEDEEEEITRPTRRLRSDSAKEDSKLSHRVSGMKNAVLKFATGVFNK